MNAPLDAHRIGRLRLHLPSPDDAIAGRQGIERLLGAADLTPPGLPPGAVVIVRQLRTRLPAAAGFRAEAAVAGRLRSGVAASVARARWPAREPVGASDGCVVFADEGELLFCLLRDWLGGEAAGRWWWRPLLGPDLGAGIARRLAASQAALPALGRQLDAAGLLTAALAALPAPLRAALADAVADRLPSRAATRDAAPAPAARHLDATAPEAAPPGPAAARSGTGAPASASGVVTAVAAPAPATPTATAAAAFPASNTRPLSESPPDDPASTPPPADRAIAAATRSAVPDNDRAASAEAAIAPVAATAAPTPIPATDRRHRPGAAESVASTAAPAASLPTAGAPERRSSGAVLPRVGDDEGKGDPVAKALAPAEDAPPPVFANPASEPPPAAAEPPLFTAPRPFVTGHGGVFFLLNLALALDLYGDFTRPRDAGLGVSPWDLLAALGDRLDGPRLRRDPLWRALAALAGRPPETPAGAGFAPAADWRLPPAWIAGLPPARRAAWGLADGRLLVRHPAGFSLAETDCAAADVAAAAASIAAGYGLALGRRLRPPPAIDHATRPTTDFAAWIDRLLPFVRHRLALALGCRRGELAPLLLRRPARVWLTPARVDVVFSLGDLPLAIRFAGLDRDPGWIPAAGRSVAFHFAAAEEA